MKKLTTIISAVIALGLGTAANAQVNLTAETASPGSAPGVSVISLSEVAAKYNVCLLYTSPSPRDATLSRMPSSA